MGTWRNLKPFTFLVRKTKTQKPHCAPCNGATTAAEDTETLRANKSEPTATSEKPHPSSDICASTGHDEKLILSPVLSPEARFAEKIRRCADMADQAEVRSNPEGDHELLCLYQKMEYVNNTLENVKKNISKSMGPKIYQELGFDTMLLKLDGIFSQIEEQKTTWPIPRKPTKPMPRPYITVVDTERQVADMMRQIIEQISTELSKGKKLALAVDLEAVDLNKARGISIVSLYMPSINVVFLVDVVVLQELAFYTPPSPATPRTTLKYIFESPSVLKLFFDCRGDNCVLYRLFGIHLTGVVDLQLMEYVTRKDRLQSVKGLDMTICSRGELNQTDKDAWRYAKHWGAYAMQHGPEETSVRVQLTNGDFNHPEATPQVLQARDPTRISGLNSDSERTAVTMYQYADHRPMHELIKQYCAHDVIKLPNLHRHFLEHERWSDAMGKIVSDETEERLEASRSKDYRPGTEGNRVPEGWRETVKKGLPAE